MRFLATRTEQSDRPRNYQSRLGADAENFERILIELTGSADWKSQPRYRGRIPDA
jgi:hypothetical protein